MKKFVLYSRQSKKSGMDSQMTLETSEFTMRHYLETLGTEGVDYEIVSILTEVKSSYGKSSRNRDTFNKAIELCKNNNASLLVSNMSRLSRNTAHGAQILEEVDVVLASSPSANKAMKQIMLVMAEDESEQQSIRRKAVYQAKVKKSEDAGEELIWGGSSPKWKESFDKNKSNHKPKLHHVKANENIQPVVQLVKDMISFSDGKLKMREIADKLNERGVTTPRGSVWNQAAISRLINKHNIDYTNKPKRG